MIELRRGSVVYYGERGEFTGKLRPGVVVQRDSTLADAPSVTLCGLTSNAMPSHIARVPLVANDTNGLDQLSFVMVDKVVSIGRARIRRLFGQLSMDEMAQVDRALRLWLDL
ncbi:type II toxin-antitoxin system PemK/MazF family toxin [Sphingomonas tabacisoli]|uniref:Type II toxin-antitoxin system PemK/MazF family toxin n=1 Tax=Sphingomonas tabacisoli TaxID=2249466 RepID=A0ABW4I1E7_9SPHN